jgi:hypothetical protein
MKNLDLKFAQRSELESAQIIEANGKESLTQSSSKANARKFTLAPAYFVSTRGPRQRHSDSMPVADVC